MDLRDLARALFRMWYVTIPVILLAGAVTVGVWFRVGATYEVTASMVLIPPKSVVEPNRAPNAPNNPLLYLGGLNDARDIAVTSMSTTALGTEMMESYGATVTLSGPQGSAAPILVATITASSAMGATSGRTYITSTLPQQLASLQESLGVKVRDRVTFTTLSAHDSPQVKHKRQVEFAVAVFSGLVGLGTLAIAVIDARRPRTSTVRRAMHASNDAASSGVTGRLHSRRDSARTSRSEGAGLVRSPRDRSGDDVDDATPGESGDVGSADGEVDDFRSLDRVSTR